MRAVTNFRQRAPSGHFDCAGRMSDLELQRTLAFRDRRGLPQGARLFELTDQYENALFRAITNEPPMRDKSVVRLSVTPSTK
jgi:hypothetical protein